MGPGDSGGGVNNVQYLWWWGRGNDYAKTTQ